MWNGLKGIGIGLLLIGICCSILLVSDQHRRTAPRRELPTVAIFQFSDRELLDESAQGCIDQLAARGYRAGHEIRIRRYNANADMTLANSIAKTIAGGDARLAITFSTPALQVMAAANQQRRMPHLFGTVTDPFQSGVGLSREHPGTRPAWLGGIGTFQPVKEVFRLAKRVNPGLTRVGVVWCTSEICSEACTVLAREETAELGITLIEMPVVTSSEITDAVRALLARKVEAIWIGGDNIVELAAPNIIETALQAGIPVFANAPVHADNGALLGLGADYYQVGRAVGDLAADVLEGRSPSDIPVDNVVPEQLFVNTNILSRLRHDWTPPPEMLAGAARVIGTAARPPPAPAEPHRLRMLHYVDAEYVHAVMEGLREGLDALGWQAGRDYLLNVSSAQGSQETLVALLNAAADERPDVLLLTSTPALQAAVQRVPPTIPVLFGAVGAPVAAGAGRSDHDHLPHITGITTVSDFAGMASIVKEIFPDARAVGTLYNPAEVNAVLYKELFEQALANVGLALETRPVGAPSDIPEATRALAATGIAAICQILDNLTDSGFPAIAGAAARERLPVFSFVTGQAEQGFAAVAVARDFEQVGRDMTQLLARILAGESPAHIPFTPVSRTRILVHPRAAANAGLTLPQTVLDKAEIVREP